MQKEPEDLEEPQATNGKTKPQGSERKEVKLCEPATTGITTSHKHTNEPKFKEKKRKDVLGMKPEEKQQESAPESKTLRSACERPRKSQEGEVSEASEQVKRDKRRPAGTGPKIASRVKSQKKVNSEANRTTRDASQSGKKGATEAAQPLGLRRSKRIANKK